MELQLNLMRASRLNSSISAWHQIHGVYSFDRNPIGPIGTRVVIYESPAIRGSFSPHGKLGFYVGPVFDGYRQFQVWVNDTQSLRTSDTIAWHPTRLELPGVNAADNLQTAIKDLSVELKNYANAKLPDIPGAMENPATLQPAIQQLKKILKLSPTAEKVVDIPEHTENYPDTDHKLRKLSKNADMPVSVDVQTPPIPIVSTRRRTRTRSRTRTTPSPMYATVTIDAGEIGVKGLKLKTALKGANSAHWLKAQSEELNRLILEYGTIKPIHHYDKPADRLVSYYAEQLTCKLKDGNPKFRVRGVYGGNIFEKYGEVSSFTSDLTTIKVHANK